MIVSKSALAGLTAVTLGLLAWNAPSQPAAQESAVTHAATLSLSGANRVMAAARADALAKNKTGAIAIVDASGTLVLLERLDNTFPAASEVSTGKARSAALFRKNTGDFESAIKNGRTPLLGVDILTPLQGGIPIIVNGAVVGAVGVSGAASAQQDEEIALAGASAVSDPGTYAARK